MPSSNTPSAFRLCLPRRPRPLRPLLQVLALLPLLLLACSGVAFAPAAPAQAALTCTDLPDLRIQLFQEHYLHRKLTPEIRGRAARNILEAFDPQRVLLLADKARSLEEELRKLFHEIGAGDCRRLMRVHKEIVARSRAAERYVGDFVGADNYALDPEASIVVDPEQRGYPKTAVAREETLQALAHFHVSTIMDGGGLALNAAREKVVKRYERRSKRLADLSASDLYGLFLNSLARALDPHTSFFSAETLEDFEISMQLSLEGIGAELRDEDGFATVSDIIPGGPAARTNALKPDDKILAVSNEGEDPVDIVDMPLRDSVKLIRGKKDTPVRLTVLRDKKRITVTLMRDTINLEEQTASLDYHNLQSEGRELKLGVLDLPLFYGSPDYSSAHQSPRDVERLLRQAQSEGVDGLVLDLSRNGGGQLLDAVEISCYFLHEGIVTEIRDTIASRPPIRCPRGSRAIYTGPLVVLTSRASASASEILAGAAQDRKRAVIVGDGQTFGKGSIQVVFPQARNGLGALKVTTGLYYRPGGASTQLVGIASDITLPSLLADADFGEAALDNPLPEDELPPPDESTLRAGGWAPVTPEIVQELAGRSRERVEENESFQRINEIIAQREEEDDGVLRLADLFDADALEKLTKAGSAAGAGAAGTPGEASANIGTAPKEAVAIPEAEPAEPDAAPEEETPAADFIGPPAPENSRTKAPPSPYLKEALNVLADLVVLVS